MPGVERQPLKKLAADEIALLKLLHRWREEAEKAGRKIERTAVAFEAGRDGFWLARWLRTRSIEAHVIHASSVAVSREHRRAKTDRLDTELLKRAFLGWLRGERDHCKMVAIPTSQDEDAKRPNRERESLVGEQTWIINRMKATLIRLGIRGFNPKLKKAGGRLEDLRTPEGEPIPPNTMAELRRDMDRRRLVSDQIRQIEEARLDRNIRWSSGVTEAPVAYFDVIEPTGGRTRKPPMFLIHGGAHTGACYLMTADGRPGWAHAFAQAGHGVVIPDWPGSGRSGYVPYDDLTGETVVAGLGKALIAVGEPAVVMTHSMSGPYGWKLLEQHGDHVAKIVAVAPGPPGNIQPAATIASETPEKLEVRAQRRARPSIQNDLMS